MMRTNHIADQLSAVSTALEDASVDAYGDLSTSAVAALLIMRRSPAISIGTVAKEVRLSHSATVRLIDRLEKDWLVRRLRRRGREVMVELTVRGKRKAVEVAEARRKAAHALLGDIDESQLDNLSSLLKFILNDVESSACTRFCYDDPMEDEKVEENEPA
ncbi:MarR family winged helix-turn-helix transcriptional regulator [Pseudovibrio brasiliensis]|uniref:MarR family transcriptional regulator n=1 Tax=Pseudovibrio brasiliensis TaxID=1898042 RepID=A0ABX8AMV9_9HYPH|nr:MarR family transcriptional regulator [Pseudovibrio brasiliensis]QUS56348.1 MarR family transcriptional regulator [Pseudovibrio brasiliensis]